MNRKNILPFTGKNENILQHFYFPMIISAKIKTACRFICKFKSIFRDTQSFENKKENITFASRICNAKNI
jgi:hypothetical protein